MTVRNAALIAVALLATLLVTAPSTGAQDEPDLAPPVVGVSTLVPQGEQPAIAFIDTIWPDETGSCTGTLVHPEWVLSAAHCVILPEGTHATEINVVLGSTQVIDDYFANPGPPPAGVEVWQSDGWVIHGDPHIGADGRWFNDVVMIHLAGTSAITPMQLTTDTSLVEPASNKDGDRLPARFYGFGLHNCPPDCGTGGFDGTLRRGDSTIYSDDFADEAFNDDNVTELSSKELARNIFLFPNLSLQGGGCFGDSGGPLVVWDGSAWRVAGVSSFIVSRTPGRCDGFVGNELDDLFLLHAMADLVGTNLGNWARSIMAASSTCAGMPATLTGSNQGDIIIGTSGTNVIAGRGGDDVIRAGAGADYACGGRGDDVIRLGKGADVGRGDKGRDTILGQSGGDDVSGGSGNDALAGGKGPDDLRGKSGRDDIDGNGGSDMIDGGKGSDDLAGNAGFDQILGGTGHDDISGGGGADIIDGGKGNDELAGKSGDDVLRGKSGDDHLDGGKGNDTCKGGSGTNTKVNC